jgi:hypothetical protein
LVVASLYWICDRDAQGGAVPTISEFHGIVIRMFHTEHPPPHFHATYGEYEGIVGLDPVAMTAGRLPPRIARLVLDWADLHREELLANWERGRHLQPLRRIDPLP